MVSHILLRDYHRHLFSTAPATVRHRRRNPVMPDLPLSPISGNRIKGTNPKKQRCRVNEMPNELLEYIFVLCVMLQLNTVVSSTVPPTIIMRVCKLWYKTAVQSVRVWAVYYPDAAQLPRTLEIIPRLLARAGDTPLTLKFQATNFIKRAGMCETAAILFKLSPRWGFLDIALFDGLARSFEEALPRTSHHFQVLKLDANYCSQEGVACIVRGIKDHCNSLRHLEFRCNGVEVPCPAFIQLPWSQLRSLQLSTAVSVGEATVILSQCISAKEIALGTIYCRESTEKTIRQAATIRLRPQTLPELASFRLFTRNVDPMMVIIAFRMPALRELDLWCLKATVDVERIHEFIGRSGCRLNSFTLSATGPMPKFDAGKLALMEALRGLKILDLDIDVPFKSIAPLLKEYAAKNQRSLPHLRPRAAGMGLYINTSLDKERFRY
ncbi:hypothetical protein BKA70DRAFT_1400078 [Coprinopsis sp. MPI-PUGE-AT-0042]|nr:hypothetical protein BKA70DRAFT_1400078 [Coprinopsis sp. MPI-PUGE-AT-0042]